MDSSEILIANQDVAGSNPLEKLNYLPCAMSGILLAEYGNYLQLDCSNALTH